jgi:hypothetical protein
MTTRRLIFVKAAAIVLLAMSDLAAQALNPPYLREMPPVDRVLNDQQTADTAETAARQMGALLQLTRAYEVIQGLTGKLECGSTMQRRFVATLQFST